jgi:hypothetical protein
MSLNGLDDAKVLEAYQSALAEPGGWFLLKYASRDAVEILTRGTGGLTEARAAIAQFEEKSPLYGFLLYRRRKVLIKHIPEGTSRLLQARVAVHFTAITEKFTPHDTIFSTASADELTDSALISACTLHTAAPSTASSGGSIRKKKLDEITEDAEEGQGTAEDTARPRTAASSIPTIVEPSAMEVMSGIILPDKPVDPERKLSSSDGLKNTQDATSIDSELTIDAAGEKAKYEFDQADYRASLRQYDPLFEHGPDPRLSSQTARPAIADLYAEIYEKYKPKVKLGPRPRQSTEGKRPHTSGNPEKASARVSTLPTGLRIGNRKTEPKRPKSRDSSVVPSIAFPPPPPVPAVPDIPLSPGFPPTSPVSVRSMPSSNYAHSTRSHGITPEKQRLMKALEIRKKQLKAQKEREEREAIQKSDADSQAMVAAAGDVKEQEITILGDLSDALRAVNSEGMEFAGKSKGVESTAGQDDTKLSTPEHPSQEDAVDMMSSHTLTDDQQSAASACSPTSAQTQSNSDAPSTRPSSLSDEDNHVFEQQVKQEEPLEKQRTTPALDSEKVVGPGQNEDEQESVESSPTVVPDNESPGRSVETHTAQPPQAITENDNHDNATEVQDDISTRSNRRESMVLLGPTDHDSLHARRREKRESMIFMPSLEGSMDSPASSGSPTRRSKRESMVLAVPKRRSYIENKDKRRSQVESIHISPSAENSEGEYMSDDSFMEELKSARVEEAKPISVSKSPISPFFPRKSSITEVNITERSASNPGRSQMYLTPQHSGLRSSSASWTQQSSADTVVVAKKINVSSGISQRIKALAEKSNRDSAASVSPVSPATTPDTSSSIVAQRKSSFFTTPPSDYSPPTQTAKRFTTHRASFINVSGPALLERKSSIQSVNNRQTVYNLQQEPEKSESVQVTARIVRDARTLPSLIVPDDTTPLELHQSPIVIDHQKSTVPGSKGSSAKAEPISPKPPVSPATKDASAGPRSSSESSWRSFGRRLSESKSNSTTRSQSIHSFESDEDKREGKKEKKDSRTSKLFKRMSSISSISSMTRKNPSSPVLVEEDHPSKLPSLREPPPAVQIGDLNVQFPDTLLWKRRWVEIDAAGNLVLSLSKANEQSKGITKRYHLSEFRPPYAPDQDIQELPNSVILDFLDGRTLQCACETYVAQVQVVQLLREAHDAWLAYGQFH